MKLSTPRRLPRRIALSLALIALVLVLAATAGTASASWASVSSASAGTWSAGGSTLSAAAPVPAAEARAAALSSESREAPGALLKPTYRRGAPIKTRATARIRSASRTLTRVVYRPSARTSARTSTTPIRRTTGSGSELSRARAILAGLVAQYPICEGATVYFGETRGGADGQVYLGSGTIVINPDHKSSLSSILNHEIWHLREYREHYL